ncbi:thiamine pyrophosphate-binding protein [Rubellimicrobium aerolatum]|uniref:Thiamine pyrophosphate-binding protein n=1 Tax=Rubellimicrobium aerolatum TaxID=490979 RepID=A0ABW0SHB0_9RHOB|nr:thiamine pyrophosphate-binding protein [Rubellimicrobium aerolatum]MBP1806637.1 acetolactate synthase-1/2/3 large subunit [Rubellimicrobium aerolatum]
MRHGGRILADQLRAQGVRRVFSVPGESFLAVLDGLHGSGIRNVVCRHEGGAAMMAEATAKLTGRPGVCLVTRGPGATNASAGVHVARQDSTPLVLLVGQIERGHRDREAFQEVDLRAMFGPLAKWVAEIDSVERIPEYMARAFAVATAGRPGPVVLGLPEDVLNEEAEVPDRGGALRRAEPDLAGAAAEALDVLRGAERPLVIAGGPHWSEAAAADLARVAEAQGWPVACAFRRQDYMDNRHPHYVGDLNVGVSPRLAQRVREADALLLLGTRLGDISSGGYGLLDSRAHGKRIVHVHADPEEPGRVWAPDLAVTAEAPRFLRALAGRPGAGIGAAEWRQAARADYEWWITPQDTPGAVKQERVIRWLSDNLPEDAILTNGAGNFAAFLHRYFSYKRYGTQLAPTSGSMGYGVPAAIAASLEHPGRVVVCVAGDGDVQMTLNELSTAVQHGAVPIVVVMNNGRYGTIRMHQERTYPGRVSGTDLANPDFAALARAYGGHGEVVHRTEDFAHAFLRAREWGTFAIIECRVDGEALTPSQTLAQAREQGLRAG